MKLKELKEQIKLNCVSDDFIVFVYEANTFLVDQYIEALCRVKNCNKIDIESIYEPQVSSMAFVLDFENNLSVLRTETFDERAEDYSVFTNTVVVCSKVDKKLEEALEPYIIKVPALQDWHISDYIHTMCPSLSAQDINWLINVVKSAVDEWHPERYKDKNGDIYRILNELDKVLLFAPEEHVTIFNKIRFDSETDLYRIGFFELIKALFSNNEQALFEYFRHAKYFDVDPIAVVNMLLKDFKQLAFVYGGVATQVGMPSNQAYAIQKNDPTILHLNKIQKAISFLSNIDLDLKASKLDMSKNRILVYVFAHLSVIYRQAA